MLLHELQGQTHATGVLTRALASGRVPHAYLFEGPPGVGKRAAAVGLALALACPTAPRVGCGICDVCQRILAGNHPDVRVIVPETTMILIEQAQQVVALAAGRPHEAPARVIIIDQADRMNLAAANCLLKTLEEPAPMNHLILVTSAPDRLLSTIRSRTQRVRFAPVALTDGEQAPWDMLAKLRAAAADSSMGASFEAAAAFGDKESKEGLPEMLALLGRFYRDAVATAVGADDLVSLPARAAEIASVAGAVGHDPRQLRRACAAVIEAQGALGANLNAVAVLERLLIEMGPAERGAVRA